LGASFGRGGATGFLQDLANSDCIVIQGSNMAECHPVGFQWVTEAKERGARVIHVDPRFTRTSALADTHVPIRAGSDIDKMPRTTKKNKNYARSKTETQSITISPPNFPHHTSTPTKLYLQPRFLGQASGPIRHLAISQSPVFLLNSRYPLVCATFPWLPRKRSSFFRSYGGNLPSSFSTFLSSALVFSTSPPVSV